MPITLWLLFFPRPELQRLLRVRLEKSAPPARLAGRGGISRDELARELRKRLPPHLARDVLPDWED